MTKFASGSVSSVDVVSVGGLCIDIVLKVDRFPGHDEKVASELIGNLPGGPQPNFACAASTLGLSVRTLSHIGTDEYGEIVKADMEKYDVDTQCVETVPGATIATIILLDPTGEKAIIVMPNEKTGYQPELVEVALSNVNYMYIWPEPRESFIELATIAQSKSIQVMIDVEDTACEGSDFLEQVLPHTSIASFNFDGYRAATGFDSVDFGAMKNLLEYGPHTIVVTHGRDGAYAVTADDAVRHNGYNVPVVDSTGAGDTFNAAFLTSTIADYSLEKRIEFACAAGAISVTGLGPKGHLPSFDETFEFMSMNEENTK